MKKLICAGLMLAAGLAQAAITVSPGGGSGGSGGTSTLLQLGTVKAGSSNVVTSVTNYVDNPGVIMISGCDTNMFNTSWYYSNTVSDIGFYYAASAPGSVLMTNFSGTRYVITNSVQTIDLDNMFYIGNGPSDEWSIGFDPFPSMTSTNALMEVTRAEFANVPSFIFGSNVVVSADSEFYYNGSNFCQVQNINQDKIPNFRARWNNGAGPGSIFVEMGDNALEYGRYAISNFGPVTGVFLGSGKTNGPGRLKGTGGSEPITDPWFGTVYYMAAGAALTNTTAMGGIVQPFTCTDIGIGFYRSNDFVNMLVYTQATLSSTPGLFRTIVTDNNTVLTPDYTNFSLPSAQSLIVTVVSPTGTNICTGITLMNTNAGNVCYGSMLGGNMSVKTPTHSAIISNSFRVFIQNQVHLLFWSDLGVAVDTTNGLFNLQQMRIGSTLESVYTTANPTTNYATHLFESTNVVAWQSIGRMYGVPVMDTYGLFNPISSFRARWEADGVHMDDTAAQIAGNFVYESLGFSNQTFSTTMTRPIKWEKRVMADGSVYYSPLYQ